MNLNNTNIWLTENLPNGFKFQYPISNMIFQVTSEFQNISIIEIKNNNKILLLNNKMQPSINDAHMYYEPLIHTPFISFQNPENILILGAGDGSSIKETLKWKSIKKITIVEIDKLVVESCIKYLPKTSKEFFKNNKVKIFYKDAYSFVKQEDNRYDIIIFDNSFINFERNGKSVFDKEFLLDCKSILNKNGLLCLGINHSLLESNENLLNEIKNSKQIFHSTKIFCSWVPSFCKNVTFIMMNKDKPIKSSPLDEVENLLNRQLLDELTILNSKAYIGLMNPLKYIQQYEDNLV